MIRSSNQVQSKLEIMPKVIFRKKLRKNTIGIKYGEMEIEIYRKRKGKLRECEAY